MFYGEDVVTPVTPVSAASCQSLALLAMGHERVEHLPSRVASPVCGQPQKLSPYPSGPSGPLLAPPAVKKKNVVDTSGYTKNGIL